MEEEDLLEFLMFTAEEDAKISTVIDLFTNLKWDKKTNDSKRN